MTLTPQQLETAARKLCELRRLNPMNEYQGYEFRTELGKAILEIKHSLQVNEAINFAMEQKNDSI
jgi:hypothetical protein